MADYSGRDLALTVRLNDLANDGEPGEAGNVGSDVEEIEAATETTGSRGATSPRLATDSSEVSVATP